MASAAYLGGSLIQGLLVLNSSAYKAQGWQGTLLMWALILIAVVINTIISNALPVIESMILVLYAVGFFAILIPLVYFAPHGLFIMNPQVIAIRYSQR